jgi:glycosyltransferase involved in cell wall biosynthesis
VRILYCLPDFPAPPRKGYQVRAAAFARHLARANEVSVVAAVTGEAADVTLGAARRAHSRVHAVAEVVARRWPLQIALFDGPDIARSAVRLARRISPHVVVVTTERLPFTTLALAGFHRTVLDIVDSQARHMEIRASHRGLLGGSVFHREAAGFERLSVKYRQAVGRTVVCAARELRDYPDAEVIPNGAFDISRTLERTIDVVFTGNLDYWPNVEAVVELCGAVLPRMRTLGLDPSVVVAGRNPTRAVVRSCASARVELLASVPDIGVVLAKARLAVAPLRSATGSQLKILEALSAGTPVLAYPEAGAGLQPGLSGVVICQDADTMARIAAQILKGERLLEVDGEEFRWEVQATRFERLLAAVIH